MDGGAETINTMSDQVSHLSATANYMGYDALTGIYDDLAESLTTASRPAGRDSRSAAESPLPRIGCNKYRWRDKGPAATYCWRARSL